MSMRRAVTGCGLAFWVAVCGGVVCASSTFSERVIQPSFFAAQGVVARDIDGDGDADVLVVALNEPGVAWFENDGAAEPSFTRRLIAVNSPGIRAIEAADMDGDGDVDLVVTPRLSERLVWLEQTQGPTGALFVERAMWPGANGVRRITVLDFDGDGDLDVVAAEQYGAARAAWIENVGGSPAQFVVRLIPCSRTSDLSASAGDMDGDGDTDLVVTSNAVFGLGWVGWMENVGAAQAGAAPSFVERTLAVEMGGEHNSQVVDFDGDGDTDVLCASFNGDRVSWFENLGAALPGGPSSFVRRIVASPARGASEAISADVDGDGDLDAISAMYHDGEVRFHERTESGWVSHLLRGNSINAEHVSVADMDGDGDLDPVAALFDSVTWYENDGGVCPGDANGDRVVNFADLNVVLSSFGMVGTPGSVPGDLNGDGVVNFADLNEVLSFFGTVC